MATDMAALQYAVEQACDDLQVRQTSSVIPEIHVCCNRPSHNPNAHSTHPNAKQPNPRCCSCAQPPTPCTFAGTSCNTATHLPPASKPPQQCEKLLCGSGLRSVQKTGVRCVSFCCSLHSGVVPNTAPFCMPVITCFNPPQPRKRRQHPLPRRHKRPCVRSQARMARRRLAHVLLFGALLKTNTQKKQTLSRICTHLPTTAHRTSMQHLDRRLLPHSCVCWKPLCTSAPQKRPAQCPCHGTFTKSAKPLCRYPVALLLLTSL